MEWAKRPQYESRTLLVSAPRCGHLLRLQYESAGCHYLRAGWCSVQRRGPQEAKGRREEAWKWRRRFVVQEKKRVCNMCLYTVKEVGENAVSFLELRAAKTLWGLRFQKLINMLCFYFGIIKLLQYKKS